MPIFEVTPSQITPLKTTTFASHDIAERGYLQRLLRDQIEVIASDVLIIAEEFCDWDESKRRIDLLGLDRDGNLVVIELKRTEDGGHMDLQAVRYAAMVSQMTFDKAVDVFQQYLDMRGRQENAGDAILRFLAWDAPREEAFAQAVRIVLASAEFSKELTTSVLWLNEQGLDIRCVRLRPHTDGTRVFLDVQQVLPLPEASAYMVSIREKREEERQSRRGAARPKWTTWDEMLGTVTNDDLAAFVREELGAGRLAVLNPPRIRYRIGSFNALSFNVARKEGYVWQAKRFEGDEAYWAEKLGPEFEGGPRESEKSFAFYLRTKAQMLAFRAAFERDSASWNFLGQGHGDEH